MHFCTFAVEEKEKLPNCTSPSCIHIASRLLRNINTSVKIVGIKLPTFNVLTKLIHQWERCAHSHKFL